MSKLIGKYTGEELLNLELDGASPIIDQFIYEKDNILLIGKEKSNKSTLALQMLCHITSGEPLFGVYNVPEPQDVVYIQAEGKLAGTQHILKKMTKVIPADLSRLLILYYPAIAINRPEGFKIIKNDIDSWRKPKVICGDPLYQLMSGDIKDQERSSEMTGNLRRLSEYYQSATILTHHAHRPRRTENGDILDEGDDSVFGSFVWKAYPDSVFLIEKTKGHKNLRKFSCNTQRMSTVVEHLDLQLIEPDPYHLEIRVNRPIDTLVETHLLTHPNKTCLEISNAIGYTRQEVSSSLNRFLASGKVSFSGKPRSWTVR